MPQDLQETAQVAAGRPDADRNRFALPRAGAASRADVRAGLRRRYRELRRRAAGRGRRSSWPKRPPPILQSVRQSGGVKVRILGCGTSTGVPRIGNDWGQCDPAEPRNRPSARLDPGRKRRRAHPGRLRARPASAIAGRRGRPLDAVIVTHDHGDHCHGIDELRPISRRSAARCRSMRGRDVLDELRAALRLCIRGSGLLPTDRRAARNRRGTALRRLARRASSTSRTAV